MKNKLSIFLIVSFLLLSAIILILGTVFVVNYNRERVIQESIKSFEDCSKYYPVQETYPARCSTPNGKLFIQKVPKSNIEIEGILTCLPYNQTRGEQDLLCAIGILANDGKHYSLSDPTNRFPITNTSMKVRIKGMLDTNIDINNRYDIFGKIEVNSLEEVK